MSLFNLISRPIIALLNRDTPPREFPLSDYARISFELKQCDVLLVEGRSRVSDVIRMITLSPWTHAALYIGRIHDIEDPDLQKLIRHHYDGGEGDRLIIESLLGRGTIIRNLKEYQQDHLRICRPSRLNVRDSQQVIRYAISRLGVEYDVRQILDLARFLFPYSVLPRKWRSSLFKYHPGRSTRTVCSTMIAEAFAFVQFPILPLVKRSSGNDNTSGNDISGDSSSASSDDNNDLQLFRRNPKLTTPSDFDYSPYFEIIKYPFVDFHHRKDYHLLPWHGTEELSEEENELYLDGSKTLRQEDVEEAIGQAIQQTEKVEADRLEEIMDINQQEPVEDSDIASQEAGVENSELELTDDHEGEDQKKR